MGRIIVALSGGKASAWCANWALNNYPKDDVILYFNDTKWEHKDLYRFLDDLSKYFDKEILYDSDGRSPEELFYDYNAIANNRMPFCSHELKALRLQKFYQDGDTIIFGISADEAHRAKRLLEIYSEISRQRNKNVTLLFPLISENVSKRQVDKFLKDAGIEEPELYKLGFKHNNCSGGCVRQAKSSWRLLYEKFPEVYADRERMEKDISEYLGKKVTIMSDESLEEFRIRIQNGMLTNHYFKEYESEFECVGICSTQN